MYHMLFRSRWVALLWVGMMVAYALFMSSGPSVLGLAAPPPEPAENAKLRKEKRQEAQFKAWAASDAQKADSEYGSPDSAEPYGEAAQ